MKRVPFDSQVPSDALRIEMKIFSQIHSRFQQLYTVSGQILLLCPHLAEVTQPVGEVAGSQQGRLVG